MLLMKRSGFLVAGLILLSAGCNIQPEPFSTLTIAPPLNPYQSTTRTPDQPTPTNPISTTQPLIPTPTPFKHTIQPGDTLYGIAILYNISFDRLVSANPGLDTRVLIVGTEVIIPPTEEENLPPTPTPYPILLEEPLCYPTTNQELWCYVLIENDQGISLDSISLAFMLYDSDQDLIESRLAYSPLNRLLPGQTIPIGSLIQNPPADLDQISAALLTAYPSDQDQADADILDYSLEYSQENTIAYVKGSYEINAEEVPVNQVWILGVGFSEQKPVAVRKWIRSEEVEKGNAYSFDFYLYSLGPEIDSVQLFIELN